MKALLVSYSLKNSNINEKTNLHRILYGYTDHSNNGSHKYERKGLLDKCLCIKLNRGVFIIDLKDKNRIMPLLKKNKAALNTLTITIPKTRFKKV